MKLTAQTWSEYVARLARLNQRAGQLMADYIAAHGTGNTDALIAYAPVSYTHLRIYTRTLVCGIPELWGHTRPTVSGYPPHTVAEKSKGENAMNFFMPMRPPTVTHHDKQLHAYMKGGKPCAVLHDTPELKAARAKLDVYKRQARGRLSVHRDRL